VGSVPLSPGTVVDLHSLPISSHIVAPKHPTILWVANCVPGNLWLSMEEPW
jgi:hypothetical protein